MTYSNLSLHYTLNMAERVISSDKFRSFVLGLSPDGLSRSAIRQATIAQSLTSTDVVGPSVFSCRSQEKCHPTDIEATGCTQKMQVSFMVCF